MKEGQSHSVSQRPLNAGAEIGAWKSGKGVKLSGNNWECHTSDQVNKCLTKVKEVVYQTIYIYCFMSSDVDAYLEQNKGTNWPWFLLTLTATK